MVRSPMRMRSPARSAWRTSSSHTNSAIAWRTTGALVAGGPDDTVELVEEGGAGADVYPRLERNWSTFVRSSSLEIPRGWGRAARCGRSDRAAAGDAGAAAGAAGRPAAIAAEGRAGRMP